MPPHILFWNDSLDFGFVSLSLSQTLVFCFANITLERTETTRKISIFKKYIYKINSTGGDIFWPCSRCCL